MDSIQNDNKVQTEKKKNFFKSMCSRIKSFFTGLGQKSTWQKIRQKFTWQNVVIFIINNKAFLLMLLMFIIASIASVYFLTAKNLTTFARQIPTLAIVAIGYTLIFTAGQFDMSVGEVISFVGVIYAISSTKMPIIIALIVAILMGALCGFVNGSLIRIFRLPAFVLTLAIGMIYKGITYTITKGESIFGLPKSVSNIGDGMIFGFIPVPTIIMLVVLALLAITVNKTIYGRQLLATGGNVEAARVSGIKVNFMRISVFVIAGACAAISAIVLTGRQGAAIPNAGDGFALDAVAAVVIGGTNMRGGKSKVVGTLWGVILVAIIGNVLTLLNVSPYWQWLVKGIIIIAAIIIDNQTEAILNKQRERAVLKSSILKTETRNKQSQN